MTSSTPSARNAAQKAFFFVLGLALLVGGSAFASPSSDTDLEEKPQVAGDIALPAWEKGACREQFDIRIWPKSTVIWLERENLKAMIADPELSEKERDELKWILVMQQAWRKTGS